MVGFHIVEFLCVHLNFAQTRAFVIVFIHAGTWRHLKIQAPVLACVTIYVSGLSI